MRDLKQDACAVSGAGIAPLCAAMGQAIENLQALLTQLRALSADSTGNAT